VLKYLSRHDRTVFLMRHEGIPPGASRTAPVRSSLTRARPGCATPTSSAGAGAAVRVLHSASLRRSGRSTPRRVRRRPPGDSCSRRCSGRASRPHTRAANAILWIRPIVWWPGTRAAVERSAAAFSCRTPSAPAPGREESACRSCPPPRGCRRAPTTKAATVL
jgi:hypothetical protein